MAASHLLRESVESDGCVALIVRGRRGMGMGGRGRLLAPSRLLGVNGRGGGGRAPGEDGEDKCVGEGGLELQSGDVVFVEELAPAEEGPAGAGKSRLMCLIEDSENVTSVTCYVPKALISAAEEAGGEDGGGGGSAGAGDDHVVQVEVDLRWTLVQVKKAAISAACRAGGGGTVGDDGLWERVHLRRTSKGPQLKDEAKRLADLGVEEGALFFLRAGAPRPESQKTLKVFLAVSAAATARPLLQLAAEETWTVAQLKTALAARLGKSKDKQVVAAAAKAAWPQGARTRVGVRGWLRACGCVECSRNAQGVVCDMLHTCACLLGCLHACGLACKRVVCIHSRFVYTFCTLGAIGCDVCMFVRTGVPPTGVLRLRQKKGSVGGSVLKDEQVLMKALPRLADDTPIVLQLLDEPEAASPVDGLLIQVRRWRVEGDAEVLEDPREMCVPRDADGHKMLELLGRFLSPGATAAAAQSGLACAKVSSFGPALKAISKAKLKWLDESSADVTVPVTSPPLGLRNDSVIVVCDQLEFERFAAAAAARVQPLGGEQDVLVLQKKPSQKRITRDTGPRCREAALQIHVHSDARFDPREHEQAIAASIQASGDDHEQPAVGSCKGSDISGGGSVGEHGEGGIGSGIHGGDEGVHVDVGPRDHVSSGNDGGKEQGESNVLREGDYVLPSEDVVARTRGDSTGSRNTDE